MNLIHYSNTPWWIRGSALPILLAVIVGFSMLSGLIAASVPSSRIFWLGIGFLIFSAAFISARWALYILIFSMLLSPEFSVGGIEGRGTLGRGVTLRLDDFLLLIIGVTWVAKNAVYKELGLVLRTPLNRPIFIYVAVCIVSTALGVITGRVSPKSGFFYVLKYFEYYVVYFMAINHVDSPTLVKRFILCMFVTCFITSLYGISQIPFGRVSAPFEGETGEPNTFGGYLMFIGAIGCGLFFRDRRLRNRILLLLMLMCMTPAFMYTQSRSSYLAAFTAALVFCALARNKAAAMGLFVAFLVVSPLVMPKVMRNRIAYTFFQAREQGQIQVGDIYLDTSTSARLKSWKRALSGWTQHPVLGFGVTGFGFIDAQFPRVLVETGIVGVSAFVYLLFCIFRQAFISLKQLQDPFFIGMTIGFIAGFAGLITHAIGANTFVIVRIMEPFWFVTGMIIVLPTLETNNPTTP